MRYGQISFSDLKSVWRIVVAVVVCQFLAGLVSLVLANHDAWVIYLCVGAAFGTLPGFVMGVAWQFRSNRSIRSWIGVASQIGLIAVATTGIAFAIVLPGVGREKRNLEEFRQLQAERLQKIDVFDSSGQTRVVQITDPDSLAAFSKGLSDAQWHMPNHPAYTHSWYVVVTGTSRYEYELHLDPQFPRSVIGYFVAKSVDGGWTRYYGTFKSEDLRPWVDAHIPH